MRQSQLIGLLLWRVGLLVAGGWAILEGARWMLRFVSLPVQIEVGFGLGIVGFVFVMFSFILERIADRRVERELAEGDSAE